MLGATPGTKLSHSVQDRRWPATHLGSLNSQNTCPQLAETPEHLGEPQNIWAKGWLEKLQSGASSGWWGRDPGWAVPQFPTWSPWPGPGMHPECLDEGHKAQQLEIVHQRALF